MLLTVIESKQTSSKIPGTGYCLQTGSAGERYMQVNISGHHVEVTQALKDYVTKKLDRLAAHFDNITNVQVTLSVEKLLHKAEAILHIRGADINATAESDDMYAAIDDLSDKIDRQLVKHKEKTLDRMQGARG